MVGYFSRPFQSGPVLFFAYSQLFRKRDILHPGMISRETRLGDLIDVYLDRSTAIYDAPPSNPAGKGVDKKSSASARCTMSLSLLGLCAAMPLGSQVRQAL